MKESQASDKRKEFMVNLRKEQIDNLIGARRRRVLMNISSQGGKKIDELPESETVLAWFLECKQELQKSSSDHHLAALSRVREILGMSESRPPVSEFLEAGLFPIILDAIGPSAKFRNNEFLHQASWTVANMCMASEEQLTNMINRSLLFSIDLSLRDENMDQKIIDNFVWALCNMTGQYKSIMFKVLDHPIIQTVYTYFMKPHLTKEVMTRLAWLCSNILRAKDLEMKITDKFAGFACRAFLEINYSECDEESLSAISMYLDPTLDKDTRIKNIMDSGVFKKIKLLLLETVDKPSMIRSAIRAYGNCFSGQEWVTDALLDSDVVRAIVRHSQRKELLIQRDGLWCLANVAAGSQRQVYIVATPETFRVVLMLISQGYSPVIKEALAFMNNYLLNASSSHIENTLRSLQNDVSIRSL